jgi:cell division protein FtsB
MTGKTSKGSAAWVTLSTLAFLATVCYFAYAAFQGDYGLMQRYRVEQKEVLLRAELAELRTERAMMANKTARLGEDYLDLDLLDERARAVLGFIRADEILIR